MKICIRSLIIFSQLLAFNNIKAQYLEFVENKGQWDSKVNFTGNLNGGAIYLQKNGYKVLLNNANDLDKISDYYSGHAHTIFPENSITKTLAQNQTAETKGSGGNSSYSLTLHSHAYEVSFVGSSPDAAITPEKVLGTYNNYFYGNDPRKWASHCNIYQAIVYKNIYPGIDVRYYTDNNKLKYDFIINPGGDVSKIALQFDGTNGLSVKNGNLIVKTSVSDVTELAPYSFQFDGKIKTQVSTQYIITGNVVKFQLGNYSRNTTLIIDPSLVFSTFTGSKSDNWGYTATYDGAGNFFAGGIAFHDGFPVSTGAFLTTYQGGDNSENAGGPYDAVIIKFSPNGSQRLYATYLGGSGDEQPHSLVADNNGDLVIAGRTHSSDFPTTQPTFGPGGGFDIFITKFNFDGTALLGSRKFGGVGSDGVNISPKSVLAGVDKSTRRNYGDDARSEVIVDAANNIYVASSTQSLTSDDTKFPVTAGAFQTAPGGGLQDGVVIKTNTDLSNVLFSSYLGGKGNDAAFVLALNPTNNDIYVAGGTVSTNFPGASNGPVLQKTYQGGECDGFVSVIKNDGTALIKSSYIGTPGNDLVYGIQFDKFSFPYVMGTTSGNWPVINSAFNLNNQTNGKQFIGKLDQDITKWQYSAKFGKGQSSPDISPTAFLVDRCENVYVSGWGGTFENREGYPNAGTSGLSVTANAIQSATDGNDFYFFVLERNATSQLYGSYFGEVGGLGDHVDGGTSRFDRQGVIYQAICANCGKTLPGFPTTPGVWSPENGAQNGAMCNLAAVKIAFELAGVGTGIRSSIAGVPRDTSGCSPLTVDFNDTIAIAKTYKWNFGDGSPEQTTTTPSNSHTFTAVGNYRVRLIAIDSATCNIADTSFTTIRVRNDKALLSLTFAKLPPCESLNYQFNNTSTAPPAKPFSPQAFMWEFGDGTTSTEVNPTHSYAAPGTYLVKLKLLDTIYCNAPDELDTTLRIAPNVAARFETPASGCAPYNAMFTNTSLAGQTFIWDFGDGSPVSNVVSPVHTYTTPGNYVVTLKAIDPSTCNGQDDTSFTLIVSPKPTANFSYSPQPPQENTAITFVNNSIDATSYKWDFGDGQQLITIRLDTVVKHIYDKTGTYNACLTAYNDYGCIDSICQPVQAIVIPVVDVPNAFTPNGDGVNDVVTVRGFGISKLNWRIYNRWGALVYRSTDKNFSWNGRYKGVVQPQEVYTYILEVEFTDGNKYQKTGDITLLR